MAIFSFLVYIYSEECLLQRICSTLAATLRPISLLGSISSLFNERLVMKRVYLQGRMARSEFSSGA